MRGKKNKVLLVVFSGVFMLTGIFNPIYAGADEDSCLLSRNGVCLFRIVVPKEPPLMVRYAAKELADYMEKIIGSRPPVVTSETNRWFQGPGKTQIWLGKSYYTKKKVDFEELKPDEFCIDITKRNIIIAGNDLTGEPPKKRGIFYRDSYDPATGLCKFGETGTLFGVYYFLKKHCGLRWYMPGRVGEIVPESPTLALEPGREMRSPHYIVRWDSRGNFSTDPEYAEWYRRIGLGAVQNIDINHGLWMFGYEKTHPKFFSLKEDGTRDTGKRLGINGFCLSSKELQDALIKDVRKKFDEDPDLKCISIMPGDHQGPPPNKHYCRCDGCMKYYDPEAPERRSMSDYVWTFINNVATEVYKTHPDRLISCCAYNFYFLPPKKIKKMSPNIAVGVVINFTLYSWSEEYRKEVTELRKFWEKYTQHLYIWAHRVSYGLNTSFGMPYFGWRNDCSMLDTFSNCADRFFIEFNHGYYTSSAVVHGNRTLNKGYNHLLLYMLGQALWDPAVETNRIFDEYLEKFYGPGSEPMRLFFERCDEVWVEGNKKSKKDMTAGSAEYMEHKHGIFPWQLYTRKVVDELLGYLKQAEEKATGLYKERVRLVSEHVGGMMRMQRETLDFAVTKPYITEAVFTAKPPSIDGRLQDKCWEKSKWLKLRERNTARDMPYSKARAAVCWDNDNLYVAFDAVDVSAMEREVPTEGPQHKLEGFEIALSSDPAYDNYVYTLFVKTNGQVISQQISAKGLYTCKKNTSPWDTDIKAKILKQRGKYFSEISIPFESLDFDPASQNRLRINLGWRQKVRIICIWRSFNILTWKPVSPVRNWLSIGVMPEELGILVLEK